jgi:iron complex outermembrane receptor protein
MGNKILYRALLVTAATAALVPHTAFAQNQNSADDAPKAARDAGNIIIVTAQRREESLQKTPVAVSVIGGEALAERAITSETDLQTTTPGLIVRASQNSNQLNYAIRGQNLDAFSNTRPGVLPYFNEIQVGGAGGSSAFYDLQSVQVLKGPQGTLFGRNATGGAVLFTSVKPKSEFGGYVDARVGNYDLRQIEGAINIPLVEDRVLARVSGFYQERDGYQVNLFKNERAGNVDRFGTRFSLYMRLSDTIENEVVVDYLHSGGNNSIGGIYSLNPTGAVPVTLLTNFGDAGTFDFLIGAFTGQGPVVGSAAAYAAANPGLDPGGINSYINTQLARGPYLVESDGPNSYKGRNLVVSNITTIDVGSDAQIKNIFGYTHLINDVFGDIDGIPYGIDDNGILGRRDKTEQFSNELQLLGETAGAQLKYVTGIYFSSETNRNITGSDLFQFPLIRQLQNNTAKTGSKTYAGYAQGTYDLSGATGLEGLAVTAGLRYTSEKLRIQMLPDDISFTDSPAVQATYEPNQSKTFNNLSWTLGLQDQVNSNLLLYAVTRRSYRNGGYNGVVRPVPGLGTVGGNGYDVETVTDAEIGFKLSGSGSTRFTLNGAVYQNWIKDAQRVAYTLVGGSPAAITVNVPKARVKGFELDGTVDPSDWLSFGAAMSYTDAKFTDNLVSVAGGAPVAFGTYPDAPKWSGSVFGVLTAPVGQDMEASLRGDFYAQSSTVFSSTGNLNPGTVLPSYEIVNLRLALKDVAAGWTVSVLVKNVFDKTHYVGGVALGELFQFNTAVPGDPRTYMANVRFNF